MTRFGERCRDATISGRIASTGSADFGITLLIGTRGSVGGQRWGQPHHSFIIVSTAISSSVEWTGPMRPNGMWALNSFEKLSWSRAVFLFHDHAFSLERPILIEQQVVFTGGFGYAIDLQVFEEMHACLAGSR